MATNKGRAAAKTVEAEVQVVAMKRAPKLLDKVSETLCNFFDMPLVESGKWTILIIKLCVAGNSTRCNVEGISEVVFYELILI